jgi:hypothetical protein
MEAAGIEPAKGLFRSFARTFRERARSSEASQWAKRQVLHGERGVAEVLGVKAVTFEPIRN